MRKELIWVLVGLIFALFIGFLVYFVSFNHKTQETKLLNVLNSYAVKYTDQQQKIPSKFTDFVEFDPLVSSNDQTLNIYAYYNWFDKHKRFEGYDSNKMTIYFQKGNESIGITFILNNGIVQLSNV